MELVIDANILFSALIKDSHVRHFLLLSGHSFYVPEFVFDEITKYMTVIQDKTQLSHNEISSMLDMIVSRANIKIIPFNDFNECIEKAKTISPDPDDIHYFALALKLKCAILSNDKKLQQQDFVRVYTAEELMSLK